MKEDFKALLQEKTTKVTEQISPFLPLEEGYQEIVISAMNYSFMAPGKRLRPLMMQESYTMFGGKGDIIYPFMAALEMIHNYSLVHDDLPAMDNDDYRRGRLTTHKKYDEATAILAGDALLNFAYETAADALNLCTDEAELKNAIRALQILTKKAGIYGMVGGQTADMQAEQKQKDVVIEELLYIHENKTAALIQSALVIGACLAGAELLEQETMEKIGYYVGVAFQIQDDILDCIGDESKLGKPVGSDEKNNKVTYVTLVGLQKAQDEQREMSEKAISLLRDLKHKNEFLEELLYNLITREK